MNKHEIDAQVQEQNRLFYIAIAQKLQDAEKAEKIARDRIQFLKEIGEAPIELETNVENARAKRKRIEIALKKRGFLG